MIWDSNKVIIIMILFIEWLILMYIDVNVNVQL